MCGMCAIIWSYFTSTLFHSNFIDENIWHTHSFSTPPPQWKHCFFVLFIQALSQPSCTYIYDIILYPPFVLKTCQLSCSKKANCVQACRSLYSYTAYVFGSAFATITRQTQISSSLHLRILKGAFSYPRVRFHLDLQRFCMLANVGWFHPVCSRLFWVR